MPLQKLYSLFYILGISTLSSCYKAVNTDTSLIFRYNEHKNISTLDPAFAKDLADINGVHQLFNGLVQMSDSLKVQPCIAKYWKISEDAKTYTFILRDDVYFHKHELFGKDSTRIVTASDFTYSFNRLLDKNIASPGGWVLQNVKHFWAENDSIFTLELKHPFPAFLGVLSMKYCSVVPKEIVEHYKTNFRSNPIGTGPFKLKRWEENIKLVLRKNNNYFEKNNTTGEKLPYLEAVAITFLPDKQSEFLQFVQENIDYISGLDASYKDELLLPDGTLQNSYKNKITMLRAPYLNTEYLGFYMDSNLPELQSKLLRKAINYGFDRKKMLLYLRNGIGIPAHGGFIPKGLPGYSNASGYSFNPEKAKQLIQQFKQETQIKNPSITLTTTSNYLSFCEYIQKSISKFGLQLKVDVIPASALKEGKANGKIPFFRASWIADYPDAENYLSLFYSSNFAPNGPNYTHFKNTTFDTWYTQANTFNTATKREKLYAKMDSLVMQEAPIVPLFYDEVIRFTQNNIVGLGINPTNILDLKKVRKK